MDIACIEISVEGIIGSLVALAVLFAFCCSIFTEDPVIRISGKTRHSWKSIKILEQACFCNSCEVLLTPSSGLFCDCCGLCTHSTRACQRKADKDHRCKDKWLHNQGTEHLWVHGNLPMNVKCSTCGEEVDNPNVTGLYGWRCAWCHRCYDNNCYQHVNLKEHCDFGEFRDMIIPPHSIKAARTRESVRLHLTGVEPPDINKWEPLIVIANTKSGSYTGANILSLLRGYLNPMQVMELGSRGPKDALQWAIKISPRSCRILVAGGDGTIGWVLNTIHMLKIEPQPSIAIMPLGTGNDLSRVLGWGSEPPAVSNPIDILRSVQKAHSVNLDRYDLQIEQLHYRLPIKRHPPKTVHMYNYFSIGVDALVTYNFHKTRESRFYLLSSRFFNKLLYFTFGTQQVMQPDCKRFQEKLTLHLDNKLIQLPELQSLVFLNIDSWGAGCRLCELSNSNSDIRVNNSFSDGVIEVFGILSSFHIAQLQCKISKPVHIGQGKQIRLRVNETVPMQADGEPWMQPPADITLQSFSQARVLKLDASK